MSTEPEQAAAIKRTIATMELVQHQIKRWAFQPPEAAPQNLWTLFMLLATHFGDASARGDIAHVGEILHHVNRRRADSPDFAAALDDYLRTRGQEASP